MHRVIYETVTQQIVQAFASDGGWHNSDRIDRAVANRIGRIVGQATRAQMSWPGSSDNIDEAISKFLREVTDRWESKLRVVPSPTEFREKFEQAIDEQLRPAGGKIFANINEQMIRRLADIVWIDDSSRVSYLAPLLEMVRRQGRLAVASLNYDNSIEILSRSNAPVCECHTGIENWSKTGSFEFPNAGIVLLKMHGSIDWEYTHVAPNEHSMPHSVIRQVDSETVKKTGFRPAVIFGQRIKLTADGPYLDLFRAFRDELANADRLTIVGYSFRDDHVNVYLTQWLNQCDKNRLRVISPRFSKNKTAFVSNLRRCASSRVEVIELRAGEGLKQIIEAP